MTTTQTTRPVTAAAIAALDQAAHFLDQLDEQRFAQPSPRLFNATIGQHLRHALDHYAAALSAKPEIDYDNRQRDTDVEKDPRAAARLINQIREDLASARTEDTPVRVRVMLSGQGDQTTLHSTLEREIAFATHHAVHHFAMIASIASELGADLPPGFGKAPSTIEYESRRA